MKAANGSGSPYRLSAVESLLRVTGTERYTPRVRDFAVALDNHGAFSHLSQSDAGMVAVALAVAINDGKDPAASLRYRIRALLSGEDGVQWDDAHAVYQAYVIAAQLIVPPTNRDCPTVPDS
ncbi:hypothetical protein [Mycobacterium sp. DBP42]|uniref:hypothetical protein n=1 Tax=Mycobacterium sp. DBP42 TaxID=2545267 RepID=UPI00110D05BF|nr:hypothetical protein [Mycobacterium sp. DBP42]TMS55400.1 hypothetical protein E0T84_03725 [Mycobacterium sp. DBP42]